MKMKKVALVLLVSVLIFGCHKDKNEFNSKKEGYSSNLDYSYENSLAYLWGTNYTIHRIDSIQGYEVVNSQFFTNTIVLNSLLSHFGQDTTSFTDNFRDTLNTTNLNNYLSSWGNYTEMGLDTIYKDFWNSHGTICYSPSIGFIDANSTKWDELSGVNSSPEPHKSFTIMIPLSGAGNQIVYHLINNSTPPSY
tara:strand:- start:78 stop:656 length:579 start_codon:yes stop_codon:yes gene_type:complete